MKYLKRYNEANLHTKIDVFQEEISDILIELKEEGNFHYTIKYYKEIDNVKDIAEGKEKEIIKIQIMRESPFKFEDIEEVVERLKSFMKMEDYEVRDFTGYFSGKVLYPKIEKDLRRQFNRFGDGEWTMSCYSFEIIFIKSRGESTPLKEELKPEVYKSAADKLTKIGHVKRPEELMKWYNILKEREKDAMKRKALEEAKKFGIYKCKMSFVVRTPTTTGSRSTTPRQFKDFTGNFYLKLSYGDWFLDEQYPEWKEYGGSLWMPFSFGIIPIDEEGAEYCKEIVEPTTGIGSDGITYWLGSFWLNLTEGNEQGNIIFRPVGNGYFECYEGNFDLADRQSAILFKKKLYDLFSGDIIIGESPKYQGGDKERIINDLCVERDHDIEEYEDIMNSIKKINLNKLYKD